MSAYNELEQSLWRRGKNIILKKLVWNLSLFFFLIFIYLFIYLFFFPALHKWNPSQKFFKDFGQIYSWNIYWTAIFRNGYSDRTLSVTASGSEKTFKLLPKNLETSFFWWKICLTTDKFSNKQMEKTSFLII